MADNKLLQQMLEHLVNDDQAKAEELFHEYVVTKSREIYDDDSFSCKNFLVLHK